MPSPDNRPVILYLYGEYWGIYFLQEKTDERFLEDHFETDIENCNIIGDWHGSVECGHPVYFNQMMNWLSNASLDNEENYQHICDLIDMDNYVNYMVFETFIANWDWPFNNMRCWQEGDGKWRWIFFDGDAALLAFNYDVFGNAAVYHPPLSWNNYPEAKLLFGKLLKNEQFKAVFEARARELCEGVFRYENTYPLFQGIVETLRPNVERHIHRFGNPESMTAWDSGNSYTQGFLRRRVESFFDQWHTFTGLDENPEAMVSVYPNPSKGEVHLRLEAELTDDAEMAIYDVLGRKVFSRTIVPGNSHETTFHPGLPAGVYFLRINTIVTKFVIQ